jgi:hypothetical protein
VFSKAVLGNRAYYYLADTDFSVIFAANIIVIVFLIQQRHIYVYPIYVTIFVLTHRRSEARLFLVHISNISQLPIISQPTFTTLISDIASRFLAFRSQVVSSLRSGDRDEGVAMRGGGTCGSDWQPQRSARGPQGVP